MAPVQLKYVVSFSSQDDKNPADNLLNPDVSKKWLSAPGEKTGRLEAEFQMEKAGTVSHLDIGTHFVFSVEILVGRSSWPMGKEFVTLLPSSTFMSPSDCRTGKNRTVVRMFKKEDFDASAVREKWDRIRILCTQPFRKDVQFGLSLFKVVSEDEAAASTLSDAVADKICSGTPPSVGSQSKALGLSPMLSASLSKVSISPFGRTASEATEKPIAILSPNGRYSRAGQLLMAAAAAERTVQSKQTSTRVPTKSLEILLPKEIDIDFRKAKKKKTIEEEISDFMDPIDFAKIDVETVTFADLRHRFEKQKKRGLSEEEKQCFINSALRAVEKYALSLDDDILTKEGTNGRYSKSPFDKKFNRSEDMSTARNADKDCGSDRFSGRQSTSAEILDVGKISGTIQTNKHSGQRNNSLPLKSSNFSGGKLEQKIPSKRKLILTEEEKQSIAFNSKIPKRNLPSWSGEETNFAKSTNNVWLSKSPPADQDIRSHFRKRQAKPSATVTSADLNSLDSTDVLVFNDDDDDLPCMFEPAICSLVSDSGVECPLCMREFPSNMIEAHASECSL